VHGRVTVIRFVKVGGSDGDGSSDNDANGANYRAIPMQRLRGTAGVRTKTRAKGKSYRTRASKQIARIRLMVRVRGTGRAGKGAKSGAEVWPNRIS
jgi:hypothetical protein